jgi:ATP-dependent Clp protease ATP-binding subunit ClpB
MTTEVQLDSTRLSDKVKQLQDNLTARVVGQPRAIREIVSVYTPLTVNMHRPGRPLGVLLFMGPTGVGKTETTRSLAKTLLGSRDSITRIDCVEYQESHECTKLFGSPPGYVGYGDPPRLGQKTIDRYQTATCKINVLLFDEIEKGHARLFDAIMTILGDGRLTLGNGEVTDFSQTFIVLTSNLGSADMRKIIEGQSLGYAIKTETREDLDTLLYKASKAAAQKLFRPEFMNRIDRIIVFRSLSRESLEKILRIELDDLHWRIWESPWRGKMYDKGERPESLSVVFRLSDAAKKFLLDEGTSELYGARELNRAVDRFIGYPMASMIATGQVQAKDRIRVDLKAGDTDLTFYKLERL